MRRRELLKMGGAMVPASALASSAKPPSKRSTEHTWRPRTGIRRPNIVLAVLDDIGFADLGCFGSGLETHCIDGLAERGLRFANFHVTALCAPTRASLLTGRNSHAVGAGNIAEWGRDLSAYQGLINHDTATLAEVLRELGYANYAVGKWHLTELAHQNASGPFDQWPTGRGFDRWYGFHGNAMDHWHPEVFENTVAAYPDKPPGYHLSEDLTQRGIHYLQDHFASATDRPFFMYLAYGACHYPLHVPEADINAQRGRYDDGWDAVRQRRFDQQLEMGIVPPNTTLPERNPGLSAWQNLGAEQKKLAAYGQEVYAAFLEHTDRQMSQLVEFLREEDELDDTIFIVLSDNGAAAGGNVAGILDVRRTYFDEVQDEELADTLHLLGTDDSYGEYGVGWAMASNAPLKWYKNDTYGGGIRAPLVVSWPNGKLPEGGIRHQFTHVSDVVPTLLELINETHPGRIGSTPAAEMQGESFAHAIDHEAAPTNKTVQYFETAGDRAIWHDGWKAVVKHQPGEPFEQDVWALYNLSEDFTESNDLAKVEPERLQAMIALWYAEAKRDGVLPMADDLFGLYEKVVPPPRPSYVFYPGMSRLDRLSAPDITQYNAKITADVDLTDGNREGVILASGDSGAGYELYLKDGHAVFHYTYTRRSQFVLRTPKRVPTDTREIALHIRHGHYRHRCALLLDGKEVATLELPDMWQVFSPNSGIRCGENPHSPISRDYDGAFVFQATLERVRVNLDLNS